MKNDTICAYFDSFGDDLKAARKALDLTRNKLAEAVGIDPRYLANIENSGQIPSIPVFYSLAKQCKLPVERYFSGVTSEDDDVDLQRLYHKLRLCDKTLYPIIEGTIDGALKIQAENKA